MSTPKEYKVVAIRDCQAPEELQECDNPEKAAAYWNRNVATTPHFDPNVECMVVLILNTRRRIKGHQLVSIGTLDTLIAQPREVFRAAVTAGAAAIILMHNHPSGDATPSEADEKVTRDLQRSGELLKIEVLDHIIMGHKRYVSLREMGKFGPRQCDPDGFNVERERARKAIPHLRFDAELAWGAI